jgi:HEPN domain-containing protein
LWLERSANDLRAAELILAGSLPSYETVSFHAQQAVEKALKAFLIRHQVEFERTHNIAELLALAAPIDPELVRRAAEADDLTSYAVEARYPSGPSADHDDARRHLRIARETCGAVRTSLTDYLDAGPPG